MWTSVQFRQVLEYADRDLTRTVKKAVAESVQQAVEETVPKAVERAVPHVVEGDNQRVEPGRRAPVGQD